MFVHRKLNQDLRIFVVSIYAQAYIDSVKGFCYYSIEYVTGATNKKTRFASYKEAKIFFDKMKFFGWEDARNNYRKLCDEWEKMEDNAEV